MHVQSRTPCRRRLALRAGLAGVILSALATAASAAPAQATGQNEGPSGLWTVANGKAIIRVVNCAGAYWGVLAWTQPTTTNGQVPAMKDAPTIGMPILLGMTASNAPATWQGHLYNAQDGQTYSGHIKLTGPDSLRVEGCVLGFLCGGETWHRASGEEAMAQVPTVRHGHKPLRVTTGHSVAEQPVTKICSTLASRTGVAGSAH